MTENIPIPETYARVAELAQALGVRTLNASPGCWVHQVDESWTITVNPHRESIDGIPPFGMLIECNGWPAGLVHPVHGGVIAAGSVANEDTFIAAVDAATKRAIDEKPRL